MKRMEREGVHTLKIEDVKISPIPSKITCYENATHSEPR